MSSTLRAAALVALPTAVISVLGIYWLQKRKKKDSYSTRRRSSQLYEKQSANFANDCDKDALRADQFKKVNNHDPTKNLNNEVIAGVISSEMESDCLNIYPQSDTVGENVLDDVLASSKGTVKVNNKEDLSLNAQSLAVYSNSRTNTDNLISSSVTDLFSSNSNLSLLEDASSQDEILGAYCVNQQCESGQDDTVLLSKHVNDNLMSPNFVKNCVGSAAVPKPCDMSCSVLDTSLCELSNDVFVENELSVKSKDFNLGSKFEVDVTERKGAPDKGAPESGCFMSYSESICEAETDIVNDIEITDPLTNAQATEEKVQVNAQEQSNELDHLKSPKEDVVCEVFEKCEIQGPQESTQVHLEVKVDQNISTNGSSTPASNSSSCGEVGGELSAVSSDSGQGGSNGPPTPTEHESMELQSNAVVYEFDFPSELCGMLIGRNGRHINNISRESGALISVNQKAFATDYQTVILQGTQKQVFDALETIKGRFPSDKFPGICFEPISRLNDNCGIQLSQITLPEGGFVDVLVSSVVSVDSVFIQQPMHPSFVLLNYLNECMWVCYNQGAGTDLSLPSPISANTLCVAPMFGAWFRAQVVESSDDNQQCVVRFVDYGGYCTLDKTSLLQIRADFTALPFQAVECLLNGINSPASEGNASAIQAEGKAYLENLVRSRSLLAEVVGYTTEGTPIINLYQIYGDQIYSINEELIANTAVLQQQVSTTQLDIDQNNS